MDLSWKVPFTCPPSDNGRQLVTEGEDAIEPPRLPASEPAASDTYFNVNEGQ